MSAQIPKFTISHVIILILILCLIDCTNLNNSSVPLSSEVEHNVISNAFSFIITPLHKIVPALSFKHNTNNKKVENSQMIMNPTRMQFFKRSVKNNNNYIIYKRQYANILKGSYTNRSTYTVKHGDTLFYIAWITGSDLHYLAQRNNIHAPYSLKVGQTLHIANINSKSLASNYNNAVHRFSIQKSNLIPLQKNKIISVLSPVITVHRSLLKNTNTINSNVTNSNIRAPVKTSTLVRSNILTNRNNIVMSSLVPIWRWPTEGNIIESFSSYEGGNKGIDIAGSKRQVIMAAADGYVVYAGNALRGYGNLIIIKHNNDYMSAYAHNDTILIHEQQEVKAGQKIATMGNTGTNSIRLHFEIRYRGKSVNPLQYLPRR